MDEGIDEFDEIEELTPQEEPEESQQEELLEELHEEEESSENNLEGDFISELLKSRGIEDSTKIKFENDEGEIEEVDWDTLDNKTKLNVLNSSNIDTNDDLDDSEIQLINAVRSSQLTPEEYIQHIQRTSIDNYLRSTQTNAYRVDDLNDDELYVADLITRTGVTEQEAYEALDRAKTNEALFNKLIGAIRSEYQKSEDEALRYNELRQLEEAQAQYNMFADSVRDQISDFTEFAGYDLNMDNEDMQELYDFITGFDAAGNSFLGKAINDPPTLVRMAWFALNGEQMIQDIDDYYKKEIASVRKESYNKGLQAKKDKPNIVYKNKQSKSQTFDDLDDF